MNATDEMPQDAYRKVYDRVVAVHESLRKRRFVTRVRDVHTDVSNDSACSERSVVRALWMLARLGLAERIGRDQWVTTDHPTNDQ